MLHLRGDEKLTEPLATIDGLRSNLNISRDSIIRFTYIFHSSLQSLILFLSNCIGRLDIYTCKLMKLHFVSEYENFFFLIKKACTVRAQLFNRKFYYENLEKKIKVFSNVRI